ncbi:MAG: hypothetical protein J0M16_02830 [Gammaproteobacteria bacterium]|nr:hypothetical protein [Gammaproteobacteria bacterium]
MKPWTAFALTALTAGHAAGLGAATAEQDFAARCARSGVILCVGFDTQAAANALGQTRYPAMSGAGSIATAAKAYPNNVGPNGLRYPAVDNSQFASGGGSLRLTANPTASENQSGGWYLGAEGKTAWPKRFGAGTTLYLQWRQRYDHAYTNQINWSALGGDGVKQIILWSTGSSCSDLQVVIVDAAKRGYPQGYSNCGGRPFYWCPTGKSGDNCSVWNTNYLPMSGHGQYLYQQGPAAADFRCVRGSESAGTCGYWRDHQDRWWTYYLAIEVGQAGKPTSRVKGWLSRGNGEPLRQFIDYGPFPWN